MLSEQKTIIIFVYVPKGNSTNFISILISYNL